MLSHFQHSKHLNRLQSQQQIKCTRLGLNMSLVYLWDANHLGEHPKWQKHVHPNVLPRHLDKNIHLLYASDFPVLKRCCINIHTFVLSWWQSYKDLMFESLSTLYWSQCYIMHVATDHLHVSNEAERTKSDPVWMTCHVSRLMMPVMFLSVNKTNGHIIFKTSSF